MLDENWLTREIRQYNEVRIFPALGSLRNRDTTGWAAGVLWERAIKKNNKGCLLNQSPAAVKRPTPTTLIKGSI